jgi:sulfate transport system ATP-binding protein
VFDFIGDSSALPVTIDKGQVSLDDHILAIDARGHRDGPATLFFRPSHVRVAAQEGGALAGVVIGSRRIGDIRRLELETGLARHRFEVDVPLDVDVQKKGRLAVQLTSWKLFPAS